MLGSVEAQKTQRGLRISEHLCFGGSKVTSCNGVQSFRHV